VPER